MISSFQILNVPNLERPRMSGQPDTLDVKYRATYQVLGKKISQELNKSLTFAGLGSTGVLANLQEIARYSRFFYLEKYINFETGRGPAASTLQELFTVSHPYWNKHNLPIVTIPGDILRPRFHKRESIDVLDYDSVHSLVSKHGNSLAKRIPLLLYWTLKKHSVVHLNFIVKCFRVNSSYEEFQPKLLELIDEIKQNFTVQDLEFTKYQTVKTRSFTQMGGCILNLKRK